MLIYFVPLKKNKKTHNIPFTERRSRLVRGGSRDCEGKLNQRHAKVVKKKREKANMWHWGKKGEMPVRGKACTHRAKGASMLLALPKKRDHYLLLFNLIRS